MTTSSPIQRRPPFRVQSTTLAAWLRSQGESRRWSVKWDPILTRLIPMPCPADELSDMLNPIDEPLLVYDGQRRETSNGEMLDERGLDDVGLTLRDSGAFHFFHGPEWLENRVFSLS